MPTWIDEFINVIGSSRSKIESYLHDRLDSDAVLAALRSKLVKEGWQIEAGKKNMDKILSPVYYGDSAVSKVNYKIDG